MTDNAPISIVGGIQIVSRPDGLVDCKCPGCGEPHPALTPVFQDPLTAHELELRSIIFENTTMDKWPDSLKKTMNAYGREFGLCGEVILEAIGEWLKRGRLGE